MGLIDANRFRDAEILAAMDDLGSRDLEWISVSHYDADHLGAVVDVATAPGVSVGAVYDRGGSRTVKDSATYREYYDWATGTGIRQPVDIGDTFTLCSGADRGTFNVVSVGTDGTAAGGVAVTDENDRGVCLHVEYGDFDLATCGDVNGTDDGSRTDVETQVPPVIGDVEVAKSQPSRFCLLIQPVLRGHPFSGSVGDIGRQEQLGPSRPASCRSLGRAR
jgi:glyoxylase-like metal-dependent hydrolase (beta-lactamase superfamily II)